MHSAGRYSYILFSDVHLGADLVQHVRPWTVERLKRVARVDRDLAAMLDHYREHPDPDRPWCLVIAGDLVDFIGMNVAPSPDAPLETALTDEERAHGLGSARDHAASKMRAVARRHAMVFERLARFLSDGHHLVLVRGNHDLDFHWEAARAAFVRAVVSEARAAGLTDPDALSASIEFHPWFYYVEGLLYVEHGHQFDAMCNYPLLLAPISPADPDRLSWAFSDWLLRTVSRPTPGLSSEGNARKGMLAYLRFGLSMGLIGALRLGSKYVRAIARGFRRGRLQLGAAAKAVREEHERGMAELAARTRVGIDRLQALSDLWPAPVTRGATALFRSVFFDRLLLIAAVVLLGGCVGIAAPWRCSLYFSGLSAVAFFGYVAWSGPIRRREVDPGQAMRQAARRIVELLPARFVVMGHTHEPVVERFGDDATYVNLGHWAVDDLDGEHADAPRTHMVLRFEGGVPVARFWTWVRGEGPRELDGDAD